MVWSEKRKQMYQGKDIFLYWDLNKMIFFLLFEILFVVFKPTSLGFGETAFFVTFATF